MPPVELAYKRTAHAKHFALGGGQFQAVITIQPQHYQDEAGDWQDCDDNLAVDGFDGFGWGQNKLPHRIRLKSDGTVRYYPQRNDLFSYLEFNVGALGGLTAPTVQGKSLVWDRPRFTVRIRATRKGIKFSATLKNVGNKIQNPTLNFPLNLVGLTYADGFLLRAGLPVARLQSPSATDALGTERPLDVSYNAGTNTLSLSLTTTGLTYPIEIDPTFTDQDVTAKDTWLSSASGNANYGSRTRFAAQSAGVGLVGFDLSSIAASATCDSSTLELWTNASWGGTLTITVNLMTTENWVEGTVDGTAQTGSSCWNDRLYDATTPTRWAGGGVFGASDYSTELDSQGLTSAAAGELKTFTLLASAIEGQFANANFSVVVRGASGTAASFRSSDTASPGEEPLLTINYTAAGGQAWTVTLTESMTVSDGTVKTPTKVLPESETVSEELRKVLTKVLAESQTSADAVAAFLRITSILAESMTVSEALVKHLTKILPESVTPAEALRFIATKVLSESMTVQDTLIAELVGALQAILAEPMTVNEDLRKRVSKVLSESMTAQDTVAAWILRSILLSESMTVNESLRFQVVKILSEPMTPSEALVKVFTKFLTEPMTVNEALVKIPRKVLTEQVDLGEALGLGPTKIIAEPMTVSEATIRKMGKVLAEQMTVSEALIAQIIGALGPITTLAESMTVAEALALRLYRIPGKPFTPASGRTLSTWGVSPSDRLKGI